MTSAHTTTSEPASHGGPHHDLQHAIEHAAHLLPSQGPITVFVHHNTLHAYEDGNFANAARQGAARFGCETYYAESRYRAEMARGRITMDDIVSVLREDLGSRGAEPLGFLANRFELQQAMMRYPLRVGPTAELRWVIAETDALRTFREDVPSPICERMVKETRRWVMRDLRSTFDKPSTPMLAGESSLQLVGQLIDRFGRLEIEQWSEATWTAFTLHLLWQICCQRISQLRLPAPVLPEPTRLRDALLEPGGADTDDWVHEVLIPFCAVFIDQGVGHWNLPRREEGFYRAFIHLYGHACSPKAAWMAGLSSELRELDEQGVTPLACIQRSLQTLGIRDHERDEFLQSTLLALRGFGGMLWQLETRGDRVSRPMPAGTLIEFLAIRLLLDARAARYLATTSLDYRGDLADLRATLRAQYPEPVHRDDDQRAFLIFQLAQLLAWTPESLYRLANEDWQSLTSEIEAFSELERRRVFQLAYERQYRIQALNAISAQTPVGRTKKAALLATNETAVPVFQLITCIDDREESFRRYVEEVEPKSETFGNAGFFASAMYYRGNAEAHYVPLCPIIVRPQHYVQETVSYSFEDADRMKKRLRRVLGQASYRMHAGSRTLTGGFMAGIFGSLATLPLVMRILFPRITAQIRRSFGTFVRAPRLTQLQLERTVDPPGPENGHIGFSVLEMSNNVERMLRDIGLTKHFSRLILICGHGSSSLNNPHESAYNCGACAGARGGPNARSFAQMANDPRVRQLLSERGFRIPTDTIFIGSYHNTCDDSVTYYDLDRVPVSHKLDLEHLLETIDTARAKNAHERSRRFESAPLNMTIEAALKHVEGRSEDLSQARPEYNHATNALCLVGRREFSRGLYLDRRAFLQSYDPTQDSAGAPILTRILQAVIPVCAGISLEYYFSTVDFDGWGAGNKLPHNIVSLLGVMEGALGDLKPGLYRQMVEIHEPMRLLFIIETTPETMLGIVDANPGIAQLVRGNWVQLATLDPTTAEIHVFNGNEFVPFEPTSTSLPEARSSIDWYRGSRDNLGFVRLPA